MLEKDVEKHFCRRVKEEGGHAFKFVSPGKSGAPDRIVLFPGAKIYFVELKSPTGKPRTLQKKVFDELEKLGFPVRIIFDKCQTEEFLREVKGKNE